MQFMLWLWKHCWVHLAAGIHMLFGKCMDLARNA